MPNFYPTPPIDSTDARRHRREIALAASNALSGRTNNLIEVTCGEGSFTRVTDQRLHREASILIDPLHREAAAALAAGGVFLQDTSRLNGSCALFHPDGSDGLRFRLVIVG